MTGNLKPMPTISPSDTYLLQEMMDLKIVPYQNIPDAPGMTDAEIEELGRQYFPFTDYSKQLAFSVYDWTSPSFVRNVLFKVFAYTGIVNDPLDQKNIANVIWTSNWPPFTPQNVDYMHSFLMTPADSEADVRLQLSQVHKQLQTYCDAQNNLLKSAFYAMPRTSVSKVPQLYSGQPDMSNLGLDRYAAEFFEFPGNDGPVGTPMEMPFEEALQTIFKVNNTITTKCVVSCTEYRDSAVTYSNGILLVVNPPPGAVVWENANYITDLSDNPDKNEYTLPPGSKLLILDVKRETISDKEVYVFTLRIEN